MAKNSSIEKNKRRRKARASSLRAKRDALKAIAATRPSRWRSASRRR